MQIEATDHRPATAAQKSLRFAAFPTWHELRDRLDRASRWPAASPCLWDAHPRFHLSFCPEHTHSHTQLYHPTALSRHHRRVRLGARPRQHAPLRGDLGYTPLLIPSSALLLTSQPRHCAAGSGPGRQP
jgi:hypothetical protein